MKIARVVAVSPDVTTFAPRLAICLCLLGSVPVTSARAQPSPGSSTPARTPAPRPGATPSSATTAAPASSSDDLARARTLFEQGQAAYAAGRFDEAATKLDEAYALTRSPELAFNVARAYERMSEYDKALHYYEIYVRDGHATAEERAQVEARMSAIREARERRRQQVFTAPPSSDELTAEARTFFLRGVSMFRRREYQAAMEAFIAAHRFAPLPEVLYNMAVTAERLGSRQDAIDYYREYLRMRPDGLERGHVEREIARLRAAR